MPSSRLLTISLVSSCLYPSSFSRLSPESISWVFVGFGWLYSMRSTDFLANEVTINYTRTKRDNIIEYSLMLSLNIHHWSLPTKTTYIGNQPTLNALQVQIHFSKLFKKKSMEPFYSVKKLNISHIQVIKK